MKPLPKVSEQHIIQRKTDILKAAKAVFCRKGFEPATMQDVVEESGMSRGGVYQYFSSTEEMMRALLDDDARSFRAFIESLIQKHENIWAALQDYLQDLEDGAGDPFSRVVTEYFVTGWRAEERKAFLSQRYKAGKSIFLSLFQEGVRRGEFKPKQPIEAITQFLMNMNDGITFEAALLSDETVGVADQIIGLKMYLKHVLGIED